MENADQLDSPVNHSIKDGKLGCTVKQSCGVVGGKYSQNGGDELCPTNDRHLQNLCKHFFLAFKVFSKPEGKRCMLDYINDTNISIVYCFIVK